MPGANEVFGCPQSQKFVSTPIHLKKFLTTFLGIYPNSFEISILFTFLSNSSPKILMTLFSPFHNISTLISKLLSGCPPVLLDARGRELLSLTFYAFNLIF